MTEVALAEDDVRFTVTIPTDVVGKPWEQQVIDTMAAHVLSEVARSRRVLAPGEDF